MAYYSFTATGKTPAGLKVRTSGYVQGPEDYPQEVFVAARAEVERVFPGIVFTGDTPTSRKFPSLLQLKRKPPGLA